MKQENKDLINSVSNLLDFVREKYNVKNNNFDCPYFKDLAEKFNKLEG